MPRNLCEIRQLDHIEEPDELVYDQNLPSKSALLRVTSIGRYKEGTRFHIFHNGFSNYSIRITLGGQGRLLYRDRVLDLKRGDIVFTNNYEPQRLSVSDEEWAFSYINLVGSPLPYYEELWNHGGGEIIHTEQVNELEALREQIKQAALHPGVAADLEINMLLTRILTTILTEREKATPHEETTAIPAWVSEAAAYIADHCNDSIPMDTIAKQFFVNRAHFSRQFKRYTGKTPQGISDPLPTGGCRDTPARDQLLGGGDRRSNRLCIPKPVHKGLSPSLWTNSRCISEKRCKNVTKVSK